MTDDFVSFFFQKEVDRFRRLIRSPDTVEELDRTSGCKVSKLSKQLTWDAVFRSVSVHLFLFCPWADSALIMISPYRFLQKFLQKETELLQSGKANVSATTHANRQKKMQEISSLMKYFIRCANQRNVWVTDISRRSWQFTRDKRVYICVVVYCCTENHSSVLQAVQSWNVLSCCLMWWRSCRVRSAVRRTARTTAAFCSRTSCLSVNTGVRWASSSGTVSARPEWRLCLCIYLFMWISIFGWTSLYHFPWGSCIELWNIKGLILLTKTL